MFSCGDYAKCLLKLQKSAKLREASFAGPRNYVWPTRS